MKKPSEETLRALAQLQSDARFERVLDWMRVSLDNVRELNDALQGIELHWGQGRAQELKEFLQYVTESEADLARFARTDDLRKTLARET